MLAWDSWQVVQALGFLLIPPFQVPSGALEAAKEL